jgi:hypothetical protein
MSIRLENPDYTYDVHYNAFSQAQHMHIQHNKLTRLHTPLVPSIHSISFARRLMAVLRRELVLWARQTGIPLAHGILVKPAYAHVMGDVMGGRYGGSYGGTLCGSYGPAR